MTAGLALLVLDAQNDIMGFQDKDSVPGMIATIGKLIAWARSAGIPVVYSRVAYRPTYIDVLPQLPAVKEYGVLNETQPGSAVVDELAPRDGDVVVVKRRVNAFYNSDLELVLRALGAKTLLFTGASTDRVVESTVREASDRGFRNVVISDGCASSSPEKHQAALDSMAEFFGEIMTAEEAIRKLA